MPKPLLIAAIFVAMILRPYQAAAVDAVYRHLRERDDNPCVVIPTGGGKTPVIATICRDAAEKWRGRVLVVAHVKELLEQTVDKLKAMAPELRAGVYSAGLNRRDTEHAVIVAGIQSVYKRACDIGPVDLIAVDEAHCIPPEGEGMYRSLIDDMRVVNPGVRVVGLTATPYRMTTGSICAPDAILNHVCYEIGVRELICDGYLSPLITKAGHTKVDTSALHVRGGEFIAAEAESLMDVDELVQAATAEIIAATASRSACLIFAAGVDHGRHVADAFLRQGLECGFIHAGTPDAARAELLARFRGAEARGLFHTAPLKYLCNVNVLTTGFDAPNVDCVALLRPTNSPGLYYQMVGRGFRLNPGKADCLVLDFAGNVLRHGPVDQIKPRDPGAGSTGEAPAKECPECFSVIAAGYARCPDCGHEFPPPERSKHDAQASDAPIVSGTVTDNEYEVSETIYSVHRKRGAAEDAPRTMRVDYVAGLAYKSEWICLEHSGFARQRAVDWWAKRSPDPVPDTAEAAVDAANAGALAETHKITVRTVSGEPFERIIAYQLGDKPEPLDAEPIDPELAALPAQCAYDDGIPF